MEVLLCIDVKNLWNAKQPEDISITEIDICPTIVTTMGWPGNYNLFLVVEKNDGESK